MGAGDAAGWRPAWPGGGRRARTDEAAALAALTTDLPGLTEAGLIRLRFLRFLARAGRHPEWPAEARQGPGD